MNWKDFIAESQELKGWLQAQGFNHTDLILLRVVIFIFRGYLAPEEIIQKSLAASSLLAAIDGKIEADFKCDIPDAIYNIVARWRCVVPCDAWFLGEMYEKMAENPRAQGLFYTAPEIIEYILDNTVVHADIVSKPAIKILDPACGCGNFLLKAYDCLWVKYTGKRAELIAKYPDQDWSDDGIHRHIVSQNLWGADIDRVAAEVASAAILLKRPTASLFLKPNVLVCDSLRLEQDIDRTFWAAKYDYVIGNPPYLSFGLRGAKKIDAEYAVYLRQAFPASAEYKLSYYVLFMERGIRMLCQGGKLGFIVPDSFLLGRYYSKIRRYILENTTIEKITHIVAPVFKKASVGRSVICILTKESDVDVRAKQELTVHQVETRLDLSRVNKGCCYGQSYFIGLPYNRFRLFTDLTIKKLIDKIDAKSSYLGEFSSGHSGIRSLSKQIDVIATAPEGKNWQRGLISGSQVERYGLIYKGHWINIDPSTLYKGGWDDAVVKERKILVRQTGFSLTACIDDQGYYHLNNLHSFVLKSDSKVCLDYLLLLLNSRLMSFYYHAVSMEYGRAMAQTDIDTLELLPVLLDDNINQQAASLVSIMQNMVKRRIAGEEGISGKIIALDDLFNQLFYRVYGIADDEIRQIESYEARLIAGRRRHKGR
ncbi:MAG: paeR7IM [Firmicutes bacterium]|nr:paeR7IM [Bacillota bacterium]